MMFSIENSTYYAHIQKTLKLLKDKENLEHNDLSVALQANESMYTITVFAAV